MRHHDLGPGGDIVSELVASGTRFTGAGGGLGPGASNQIVLPTVSTPGGKTIAVEPASWADASLFPFSRVETSEVVIRGASCVFGNHISVRQGDIIQYYLCEGLPRWWRVTPLGGASATLQFSTPGIVATADPVSGSSTLTPRDMGMACTIPVGLSVGTDPNTAFAFASSSSYVAVPGPAFFYPGDAFSSPGKGGDTQGAAGATRLCNFRDIVPNQQPGIGFIMNVRLQAPPVVKSNPANSPVPSPIYFWVDTVAESPSGTEVKFGDFAPLVAPDGSLAFSIFCDERGDRFGYFFPVGHGGLSPGGETEVVGATFPYWRIDWEVRITQSFKKVPVGVGGLTAPGGTPALLLQGQAPRLVLNAAGSY